MALTFDVYLIGPAPGVSREALLEGMGQIFGQLPEDFLSEIGDHPICVKAAVDLDLAQRFVDSIKGVGGHVEMVRAGAPAPGAKIVPPAALRSVGSYAGARGQRLMHRRASRRAPVPTGPQPTVPAAPGELEEAASGPDAGALRQSSPGILSPGTVSSADAGAALPLDARGLPLDDSPGVSSDPHGLLPPDPYGSSLPGGYPPGGVHPLATGEDARAFGAADIMPAEVGVVHPPGGETDVGEVAEDLSVPEVAIELEPIHPNHPLRSPEHLAAMHSLKRLSSVATPFDKALSLGILGEQLDPMIGEYIAQHLHIEESIELYFAEPHDDQVKGVAGIALTPRCVAWREAKIPLSRLETVGIQCDPDGRPYVEVVAGGETFTLPYLENISTLILGETLARVSPRRQLWVGPRATRRLRADLAETLGDYTRTALSRADDSNPVRKALRMVRYYYDMVQRLIAHWESVASSRWGSAKHVPVNEILGAVSAPEFLEFRDRLKPEQHILFQEMLMGVQAVLGDAEGVLALFEFRDDRWAPPLHLDEIDRGAFMLLRYGLPSERLLRNATHQTELLGTFGVLTNRRIVFVRPGKRSAMAEINLGKIEDVIVLEGDAPRLLIKYLDSFDHHHTLRYASSGNYLFPKPWTPLQHLQRLAARILEAQERYWELQQPPLAEAAKLPDPPPWLGEVLAAIPRQRAARLNEAVLSLLRDTTTPREVRKLATTGKSIQLTALRGLRERAAASKVTLSGLGDRILHLPGDLFDRLDDGILVAEEGILVAGLGVARLGWNEILRMEVLRDRSWKAALIGGTRDEVGIRSKNDDLVAWLGTLISTLVHAAAV